jgi:hypothetical protein
MTRDLILYSTTTFLAFAIAEQFYNDIHYAWCSPNFSYPSLELALRNPPSSTPREIYERLHQDVTRGDGHSEKILANRIGIQSGAAQKAATGAITVKEKKEIFSIARAAPLPFFKPLLYVIPFSLVADRVRPVPVTKRANPISREYIIDELPRSYFDVIEYRPT